MSLLQIPKITKYIYILKNVGITSSDFFKLQLYEYFISKYHVTLVKILDKRTSLEIYVC